MKCCYNNFDIRQRWPFLKSRNLRFIQLPIICSLFTIFIFCHLGHTIMVPFTNACVTSAGINTFAFHMCCVNFDVKTFHCGLTDQKCLAQGINRSCYFAKYNALVNNKCIHSMIYPSIFIPSTCSSFLLWSSNLCNTCFFCLVCFSIH